MRAPIDTHELAWAAGFVDGEGHFGFSDRTGDNRRGSTLLFSVAQVDRAPLERLQSALGGVGNITGPRSPRGPNQRPYYVFRTYKFEHWQHALATLWKWLGPTKRTQAITALNKFQVRRAA